MADIHSILKEYWGYHAFRPLQEDIISTVLSKQDCLALLPTGGGKSLCFQVPAMAMDGLCLVVSPLIALMKDQVENLRRKNITAFAIHSGLSRKEVIDTLKLAGRSNCRFLYVSPERLETNLFKEYLHSLGINLIAVDEAHCISQWGYDFRPSYLKIALLREELPQIPVLALTASATPEVQQDICEKLLFHDCKIFRQSFLRPNLSYSVFKVPSKINKILDILSAVKGTAIIYCGSRKRTKEISDLLNMHAISADYYHAGLPGSERNQKQEAWIKNITRVMVCTNAFGMGIDKQEVRTVIHADMPDCLENYYQEAGRAGRDGKKSYVVLLHNDKEVRDMQASSVIHFPSMERIRTIYQALMNYLQVPAGSGEGLYYEFNIGTFIKMPVPISENISAETQKDRIGITETIAALKTLEQEELLYFNEQVFVPSKIQVIAERKQLNDFEKYHPELDPLVKALLRNYEGIMDMPVNIYEKNICRVLKVALNTLTEELYQLQSHGIIKYAPQKEKPQVYLIQNRVKASELRIDLANYIKRKKQYESRVAAMINYALEEEICRSVMIGNYFGDKENKDCGICDICINKKKKPLSKTDFEIIHDKLRRLTATSALSVKQIMQGAPEITKEKLMEAIHFLQSENRISISDEGLISSI